MSFKKAIQNQAIKVSGNANAERLRVTNKESVRSEIASFSKTGKVWATKTDLESRHKGPSPETPPHVIKTDIDSFLPEELAEMMVIVVQKSLDVIYLATRDWAATSMVVGGTVPASPMVICPPGSVKPGRLISLPMFKAQSLGSQNLPPFARRFADGLIDGYGMSLSNWLSSLQVMGPLFPVAGDNIPWPVSQLPHLPTFLDETMMKNLMLSSGASLPMSKNSQSTPLSTHSLEYVARVASGMLKYSISVSMIRNMTMVGGVSPLPGAPVTGAVVISRPGVFSQIGEQLPDPRAQGMLTAIGGAVDGELRENMVKAAYSRAGIEAPPTM